MSYAVKILTPADIDTVEAALWYDAQAPGLGAEFMEEVDSAAQRLSDNPEIHRIRFADVRRAPVDRFKFYGLYYRASRTPPSPLAPGEEKTTWLKSSVLYRRFRVFGEMRRSAPDSGLAVRPCFP